MNSRLSDGQIIRMANDFVTAGSKMADQQAIVDALGNHPVNHAKFSRRLAKTHKKYWEHYLGLTAWMA
jgi:hypothetical protein